MKIGSLLLNNPLIMAPMAGITNLPFRRIVKGMGCALVTTEMISATGLVRHSKKTEAFLESTPSERPLSVQLFGSDPKTMADAAVIATEMGADIIDINFGCPAKKVLKNGSGAALMRDIHLSHRLLVEVRKAISIPLTIKIRTGWASSGEEAFTLAQIAEECGVDAITIHPRTVAQKFGGISDWSLINRIKEKSAIPIIGNGDVTTPHDVLKMLSETGCDGVMIGRCAIGNPWLFQQSLELLEGRTPSPITLDMRKKMILEHIDYAVEYWGEYHAALILRGILPKYVKSLPHCSRFREKVVRATTKQEAADVVCGYFEGVSA
ncbi:MAG: tRNA dihydrouridine synthase DusB [Deltaproteobacteria bacterium]|nr:tRNA dihydrouridine synthase DusB [Deltaproteobacteria bacterium]